MVYITGDTHGNFKRIKEFCQEHDTSYDDTMIILGDAGINYFGDYKDKHLKEAISHIPITLFCIHGNHEMRPYNVEGYQSMVWNGGVVSYQPQFPSILFAPDGMQFQIDNHLYYVIGGAYSVDKFYRLERGMNWFEDEQPDKKTKEHVELTLQNVFNYNIDIMLTHTCPIQYEPIEVFLPMIDQSTVDKSTEEWLGDLEEKLTYNKWYCGHYHTDKSIDKMRFMFKDVVEVE